MLLRDKHSTLLDPFVSYAKNEMLWIRTQVLNFKLGCFAFTYLDQAAWYLICLSFTVMYFSLGLFY